jgi:hypothetical protein
MCILNYDELKYVSTRSVKDLILDVNTIYIRHYLAEDCDQLLFKRCFDKYTIIYKLTRIKGCRRPKPQNTQLRIFNGLYSRMFYTPLTARTDTLLKRFQYTNRMETKINKDNNLVLYLTNDFMDTILNSPSIILDQHNHVTRTQAPVIV